MSAQVHYEGQSTHYDLRCARVVHTDAALPDAPHGMVITEVEHTGARDRAYRNTFKAIPANRRFRLPLNEARWPKIPGTLSARVTSLDRYRYAYLTQAGYYVVRFDFDFDEWSPGGESVPLRLAKPFAGKSRTGMHFPARDGDEAVIAFRDADPNKPFISAFHHHGEAVDLITNQDRWLSRNVIRTQSDNKLQMEDWQDQEHVKLSTEHSGKSQLTLGHIVAGPMIEGQREKRGEGFELRTDAQGALRAGGGLLVSADLQRRADGKQTDMTAANRQMQALMAELQELREAARQSKADIADLKAQNAWLRSDVEKLSQVVALSAPNGIAMSTPDRVAVMADKDIGLATKADAHLNAIKNVLLAAGNALSFFAAKLGIKMFAAQGKIDVQAQSGPIDVLANQQMRIMSTTQDVLVAGKTQTLVTCGGATFTIDKSGNVIFQCPGVFHVKATKFIFDGPESADLPLPVLPTSDLTTSDAYSGSR